MPGWYEIREYSNGLEFQLRSNTGALLLTGPRVKTLPEVVQGIQRVRGAVHDPFQIDRRINASGEPYFGVMDDARGELAYSPAYATLISREYAIEAARHHGITDDVRAAPAHRTAAPF